MLAPGHLEESLDPFTWAGLVKKMDGRVLRENAFQEGKPPKEQLGEPGQEPSCGLASDIQSIIPDVALDYK